jgi:hypothetical protein
MRSDEKTKSNDVKTRSAAKKTQFQVMVEERKATAHAKLHADDKVKVTDEAKDERREAFLAKKARMK